MQNWIELECGELININALVNVTANRAYFSGDLTSVITDADHAKIKARLFPSQPLEVSVTSDPQVTVYEAKNTEAEKALHMVKDMRESIKLCGKDAPYIESWLNRYELL